MTKVKITRMERRWNWHTWNLLLQIQEATDGQDTRQLHGDMTERNLCVGLTSELRALHARRWVLQVGTGEIFDDDGNSKMVPAWVVTPSGRQALIAAVKAGLTIR